MKNLKHPNIPIIYDMEEDDNYTYIIEQYIEGESLKCLCNKRLLSETEIYHLIIHIGHIFQYLHSVPGAIAYCDLKPEINDGLRDAAASYGAELIELKDIEKCSGHPNIKGMEQIAQQVLGYIERG